MRDSPGDVADAGTEETGPQRVAGAAGDGIDPAGDVTGRVALHQPVHRGDLQVHRRSSLAPAAT